MLFKPEDLAIYLFCPHLFNKKEHRRFFPKESIYVEYIKKAILLGEEDALLKERLINVKRLTSGWDKTWWPFTVQNQKIKIEKARQVTVKAIELFIDYCKYEFTDSNWPTIGVNIPSEIVIEGSILVSVADIVKTEINNKKRNTTIISLSNRNLNVRDAAFDNYIKILLYSFYSGQNELMQHINLYINEKENKLNSSITTVYPGDILEIEKTIRHTLKNINNNVKFMNSFACKECRVCPEFK